MSIVISEKENDIDISLLGHTIIISQDEKKRQALHECVKMQAQNLADKYKNEVKSFGQEFDALYENGLGSLPEWLDQVPDIGVQILKEYRVTDVSRSVISDMISDTYENVAKQTINRYVDAARYLANYIQDRYDCRIEIPSVNWTGSGFTVSGAIKGALTASAMNLASALLVSVGQTVLDLKIASDIKCKKAEIVTKWKLDTCLYDAVYHLTQGLTPVIEQILTSHNLLEQGRSSQYDRNKIYKEAREKTELYKRTKSKRDRDSVILCWIQLIQHNPREIPPYVGICELFAGDPQFFEVKKDLDKLTEFLGIKNEYKFYLTGAVKERVGPTWFKPENTVQEVRWKIDRLTEAKNLYPEFANHPDLKINSDLERLNHKLDALRKQSASSGTETNSGGCFITSAVCRIFDKPDDCYELTAFRNFRDNWLLKQPDGQALIQEYYGIAPAIVERIDLLDDCKTIYQSIWDTYLALCLHNIETQQFTTCKNIYMAMVNNLKQQFGGLS